MKKNRKNKTASPPGLPPEEKQPIEEQPKKQPFLKRLLFGEETPDLSELEAGSTTILDILSPTSVDTKSRDYIVVDGIFHAYLYITGYGYSTTVGASWLAPLVEAGEGVSISFHFDKHPKEKILAKISQQTMMNRSRMRDIADTRQDFEELDSAIASGMYLKDVMNRQGEDFYYMLTHSMPRTGWLLETIITCSASVRRAAVSPAGSSFRSSWAAQSAASPRSSRMPKESFLNVFLRIFVNTASM